MNERHKALSKKNPYWKLVCCANILVCCNSSRSFDRHGFALFCVYTNSGNRYISHSQNIKESKLLCFVFLNIITYHEYIHAQKEEYIYICIWVSTFVCVYRASLHTHTHTHIQIPPFHLSISRVSQACCVYTSSHDGDTRISFYMRVYALMKTSQV